MTTRPSCGTAGWNCGTATWSWRTRSSTPISPLSSFRRRSFPPSSPDGMMSTADVLRMGRLRTLLQIRLPAAGPHLITGVKLSVAYSVIGIVAGEFILATAGMGKRIAFGYQDFDNRTMYGMLLLLLVLVMAINGALALWEKRLHRRFGQQ